MCSSDLIAVVGDEEIKKGTLSLRIRGQGSGGEHTIADFIENIKQETNKFLP